MTAVSVIVPVCNAEAYLRQCLDSLVAQTLRDIEVVCVDDGSTDGSAAILAEYAAADPRVKVISRGHSNAGACRNAGIASAGGEYLGFVDADDWCDPSLFGKAYAKAKSDDADVVSWRFRQYDERTKRAGAERVFPRDMLSLPMPCAPEDLGDSLFTPIAYAPWARLVRRSFVEAQGIRFQEMMRTNDVYFCCMVCALARRQTLLDESLYTYRVGTGSNLQSGNAASPALAFAAWEAVAGGLRERGLADRYRRALASAATNSLFYTLNAMPTTESYCDFFSRMKRLYSEDAFYSGLGPADIASVQAGTFLRLFAESAAPLDFLVKQENYYRERLSHEYWSRVSAQGALADARSSLEKARARADKLAGELDAVRREKEDAERESARRAAAYNALDKAKRAMERSFSFRLGRAATWLPRKLRGLVRRRGKA